jgi:hypothetical protein
LFMSWGCKLLPPPDHPKKAPPKLLEGAFFADVRWANT